MKKNNNLNCKKLLLSYEASNFEVKGEIELYSSLFLSELKKLIKKHKKSPDVLDAKIITLFSAEYIVKGYKNPSPFQMDYIKKSFEDEVIIFKKTMRAVINNNFISSESYLKKTPFEKKILYYTTEVFKYAGRRNDVYLKEFVKELDLAKLFSGYMTICFNHSYKNNEKTNTFVKSAIDGDLRRFTSMFFINALCDRFNLKIDRGTLIRNHFEYISLGEEYRITSCISEIVENI
jgi:hypothetical protein